MRGDRRSTSSARGGARYARAIGTTSPLHEAQWAEEARQALSVSELVERARAAVAQSSARLVVRGELLEWKPACSGHRYGTLSDGRSQIPLVMYARDARLLSVEPESGLEVLALGGLSVYPPFGRLQFVVNDLRLGDGRGLSVLARDRLLAKLRAEGLLDPNRKRPLPRFPRAVGIVTSGNSAALADLVAGLRRRAPWTEVVLATSSLEGPGAARSVAAAIRRLAESGRVEVLIVARGGGSAAAIAVFDAEPVVRAIATSPVPVISAIGHELHVTLADLVADCRAATPSAAAELAVPDQAAVRRELSDQAALLCALVSRRLEARKQELKRVSDRLAPALHRCLRLAQERLRAVGRQRLVVGLNSHVRLKRETLARIGEERVTVRALRFLEQRERAVGAAAARLDALSPLRTLARGYAIALNDAGSTIRSIRTVRPGDRVVVLVADGRIDTQALRTTPNSEGENGNRARDGIRGPPRGDRDDRPPAGAG